MCMIMALGNVITAMLPFRTYKTMRIKQRWSCEGSSIKATVTLNDIPTDRCDYEVHTVGHKIGHKIDFALAVGH